ncbi:unnamed protein product, partial [Prorocentrum cordatum]
ASSAGSVPSSPASKRADSARTGCSSGSPPTQAASTGSGQSSAGPPASGSRTASSNSRSQRHWKMYHQQQRSTSSSSAEDLESRVKATSDRQPHPDSGDDQHSPRPAASAAARRRGGGRCAKRPRGAARRP